MTNTRTGTRHTVTAFNDDTRARIPFALIGVLLLVTSSAYAAGLAGQGLMSEDRSVERAVERADADTTAALKIAAREAAHDAASRPVTRAPSEADGDDDVRTTDAVRAESAFEDAFRIRLALAAEGSLSAVEADVNDVSAGASFGAADGDIDPDDLRSARDAVTVERVADGTATRVTFEDVTITATRDGRTVAERTRNRTVVVAVPTLAAHERTEKFETRLNRGPVEGAGLGRQLTASLYPMTWARGYAQYGGAPVQNVLANRHVELSTNAGIVRTQRDVFGTSDPDARGGVAEATARTGLTDLLAPTSLDESAWTSLVLDTPTPTDESGDGFEAADAHTDEETTVSIDHAADVAALEVYDDIETIIEDSYRVETAVDVSVNPVSTGGTPRPPTPEGGEDVEGEWVRVDTSTDETVRVVSDGSLPTGAPDGTVSPGEKVSFGAAKREVVSERTATATWERVVERDEDGSDADPDDGNGDGKETGDDERDDDGGDESDRPVDGDGSTTVGVTASIDRRSSPEPIAAAGSASNANSRTEVVERTTTEAVETDQYSVIVSVRGVYAPDDDAPDRSIATFGNGDAAGPDLSGAPRTARSELDVDTIEGVETLAYEAVVDGDDIDRSAVVFGGPGDGAADRIGEDLDELRTEVREIETTVSMEDASVGSAEPHGELAETVRDRRSELIDAPTTYDGAEDRARASTRAVYLDAVVNELEGASADRDATSDEFFDRVGDAFDGPSIAEILASREAARDTETYRVGDGGPGGSVTFVPDGSPGYLPRTAVDGADIEAVDGTTTRPLDTRNLNYVTVPYGDVAGGVVDRVLGTEDTVRIGVAGRALVAADDSLDTREDPDLEADREVLAERVEGSMAVVDDELVSVLEDRTSMDREESESVVRSVARTYESPGERAIAIDNGEYTERIVAELDRREPSSGRQRATLNAELHVRLRTTTGRDAVRIPTRFVEGPTELVREEIRGEVEGAIEDGAQEVGAEAAERWAPKPVRSVGAGLPVAPIPGYWVATVNAWRVQVRGEYPRFTLRSDVGTPDQPFEYVREESTVSVNAGGERVRLGATEPVAFETGTIVVIAVPAGPPGVGDVDGTRDETSPGW